MLYYSEKHISDKKFHLTLEKWKGSVKIAETLPKNAKNKFITSIVQ